MKQSNLILFDRRARVVICHLRQTAIVAARMSSQLSRSLSGVKTRWGEALCFSWDIFLGSAIAYEGTVGLIAR